jgi:hypothetical protein
LSGGITQEVVLTGGVTQTVGDFDRSLQTLYDVTSFNPNISPTLKPVILNDLNEIMKERSKFTLEELKNLNNPVTQKLINAGMKIQLEQVREANDSGGITKPFFSEGRKNLIEVRNTLDEALKIANQEQKEQLNKIRGDIENAINITKGYDAGLSLSGGVVLATSIPVSMSLIEAAPLIISASKTAGVDGLIVVSTIGTRYGGEVLKALNQAVNDPNTYVDIIEGNWAGVLSNFIPLDKAVDVGKFIQDTPLIQSSLDKILRFHLEEFVSIKLTNPQRVATKRVIEINHMLNSRDNLSGDILDAGHIKKLTESAKGLEKSKRSIEGSLQNREIQKDVKSFLANQKVLAEKLLNQIKFLIGDY